MGCICTGSPEKPSNLDILKEIGEPNTISQNQKPDNHFSQKKHSSQDLSFKNCAPGLRNEEVNNKSTSRLSETYSLDSKAEYDLSFGKSRNNVSLTLETTSDMKQSVGDFNLVAELTKVQNELVQMESKNKQMYEEIKNLKAENYSLKTETTCDMEQSIGDIKLVAELTKARKKLERMESKNKQKDGEIKNLKAENYSLKENTKSKAVQISLRSLTLKERVSSFRRRREEIEKSSGISQKMLKKIQKVSSKEEQEDKLEPATSMKQVSKLNEILPEKEASLWWQATPRESRSPEEIVETESRWTFSEPIVLQ